MAIRSQKNCLKTRRTVKPKKKKQFIWRNAFYFGCCGHAHFEVRRRWIFFCCAPAKLPRECHRDFAFKSSKPFLTALMPGVMHNKCLFDKFLSSGKNKSHICIANSTLLPGNDCEFISNNWDVKMLSIYDSTSGNFFFLLADAEICGKYTSQKVLLKSAKLQHE